MSFLALEIERFLSSISLKELTHNHRVREEVMRMRRLIRRMNLKL
jgi:hypothetical protein